jgi:hydrophobe/amphiphile efflux-1 (HAE1) family protein
MSFSHFFISRPIFASVISIVIMIVGGLAYFNLPVAQYPEVAPPTIQVTALYPGASAETIARTVATPIEQEINGVEGMLYMLSQNTNDGVMTLTVTFELGTDLDEAQVLVQNRVAIAEPRLPESVRRLGVTTRKNSPDLMMVVNLFSPDETFDQIYIANYAVLQLRDRLSRIDGVGAISIFGASEYAMRLWIDPDLTSSLGITPDEILTAVRSQNVQVASGTLNMPPIASQLPFQIDVLTQGRLESVEQLENVIIKTGSNGRIVRLRDIGRVELGAQNYSTKGYLGPNPAVALPIFQRPGSNAIKTAEEVILTMAELSEDFPDGLEYEIAYNPTEFVEESIFEVIRTIFEAVALVVIVIILFLQSWRAALIPITAIPVSLVGTFAVMQAMGFSLNNLTLFGLVLAIGIVVDNAIVVVENVERLMEDGMSPREASIKTMTEVSGALVAMTLVLVAVFLPTTFITGISGQFYRQFGVTITVSTLFSLVVSLTLSPALTALLLKPKDENKKPSKLILPITIFFNGFNWLIDKVSLGYAATLKFVIRFSAIMVVVYIGLVGIAGYQFQKVPRGFIPAQDQGYFVVPVQLPPGASLDRTDRVIREASRRIMEMDGIENVVCFTGFDGASFTNASNAGAMFPVLEDFETRNKKGLTYDGLLQSMQMEMSQIQEAAIFVIPPPPVRGIGNSGGFRIMIQDRQDQGYQALMDAVNGLLGPANGDPAIKAAFSFFSADTPQLYLDIDRQRARMLGVPMGEVFSALEMYMGSSFVNDFNYLGRTFRVTAQGDAEYRLTPDDLMRIRVRSSTGAMVPIGSVATLGDRGGPSRAPRYNLYPAAAIVADTADGFSTGQALDRMEELADANLPFGYDFEWTELAFQQKAAGNTAVYAFAFAVLFVFLLLAAQYESWSLPFAIILIVPMALLSAMTGVIIRGMDNNILTQIGLVVLIGLATKNAILIVEFAKQLEDQGMGRVEAAIEAGRLRMRPIFMTAFAFILGVVPLVIATGAGAEMRQALGTAVFFGMLGVTLFGLVFTPVFYVLCRLIASFLTGKNKDASGK